MGFCSSGAGACSDVRGCSWGPKPTSLLLMLCCTRCATDCSSSLVTDPSTNLSRTPRYNGYGGGKGYDEYGGKGYGGKGYGKGGYKGGEDDGVLSISLFLFRAQPWGGQGGVLGETAHRDTMSKEGDNSGKSELNPVQSTTRNSTDPYEDVWLKTGKTSYTVEYHAACMLMACIVAIHAESESHTGRDTPSPSLHMARNSSASHSITPNFSSWNEVHS